MTARLVVVAVAHNPSWACAATAMSIVVELILVGLQHSQLVLPFYLFGVDFAYC